MRVFDVVTGFRAAWQKILKRARISNFRWHDLRHHFASRLVQHGVPLNTVRDLLGHSTVGMSLRYAHLAPDQRREAVAKLNEKPVLALSMRLKWEGFSAASCYWTKKVVRWAQNLSSILACAYKRNRKHLDFLIENGEGRFSALTMRLRRVGR
jgi:hypothetical protein